MSGAYSSSRIPGRKTRLAGPLRSTTPATVSTAPASSGRQRRRAARATFTSPMTVSSAPVRMPRRIRRARPGRVKFVVAYLADEPADRPHTTTPRRRDRSPIAAPSSASPFATMLRSPALNEPYPLAGCTPDPDALGELELRNLSGQLSRAVAAGGCAGRVGRARVVAVRENFATVLETVADVRAGRTAVTHGDRGRTWAELDDRASRLAAFLAGRGIGAQARVAIALYNGIEYLESVFGVLKLRAIPVNVNYRY